MSEIKAIEKLRESSHLDDEKWTLSDGNVMLVTNGEPIDRDAVNWGEQWRKLADEIEREYEQRVAELNGAICERDGRIGAYERRNTELNEALKAICKRFGVSTEWSAEDAARKVHEALESQYMELPKDADGVPIRVGDYLQLGDTRGKVAALTYCPCNELPWEWQCDTGEWFSTAFAHHYEPRTVEDVLCDLFERKMSVTDAEREIHDMLGSDAE